MLSEAGREVLCVSSVRRKIRRLGGGNREFRKRLAKDYLYSKRDEDSRQEKKEMWNKQGGVGKSSSSHLCNLTGHLR